MTDPAASTYTGCVYLDGRFTGEREDKTSETRLKRPIKSMETMLRAFERGFPGRLSVECKKDCAEGGAVLTAAWRDLPNEPLHLTEAVEHLPQKMRKRLAEIQRKGFEKEFEG